MKLYKDHSKGLKVKQLMCLLKKIMTLLLIKDSWNQIMESNHNHTEQVLEKYAKKNCYNMVKILKF